MKTISDLNALIPTIVKQFTSAEHEFGESVPADNYFAYEKDGWLIEVEYQLTGEWDFEEGDYWLPSSWRLVDGEGEITKISAHYYVDDLEDTEFSEDDLQELWNALEDAIEKI